MNTQETIRNILENALCERELSEGARQSLASAEIYEKLETLFHRLVETNKHMNITAITELSRVALLHFADSISAEKYIPENAKVIDVGCGGGFPGLPLAIIRPDISILSLDSTAKKLTFVSSVADELHLSITTLPARAEDAAILPEYRENFDVAVSRAVARLNILSELCLPFVRKNGVFVAMKGQSALLELAEAEDGIKTLGATVEKTDIFTLSDAGERGLIICRKTDNTPNGYPRPYGKIKKSPL